MASSKEDTNSAMTSRIVRGRGNDSDPIGASNVFLEKRLEENELSALQEIGAYSPTTEILQKMLSLHHQLSNKIEQLAASQESCIAELTARVDSKWSALEDNLARQMTSLGLRLAEKIDVLSLQSVDSLKAAELSDEQDVPFMVAPSGLSFEQALDEGEFDGIDRSTTAKNMSMQIYTWKASRPKTVDGLEYDVEKKIAYLDASDITKPEHNVRRFFKTEGCAQAMVRSDTFFEITMLVIAVNVIFMGIEIEHNTEAIIYEGHIGFLVCEFAFCAFFLFEWFVRFIAFEYKRDCFKDNWFLFDTFLVAVQCIELFCLSPVFLAVGAKSNLQFKNLRLLRLLRLTNVVRVARTVPSMMMVGKGTFLAIQTMVATFALLVCLAYSFALAMRLILRDENDTNAYLKDRSGMDFSTVLNSFWTLGQCTFMLDGTGFVLTTLVETKTVLSRIACGVLFCFLLLSHTIVLNVLLGEIVSIVNSLKLKQKEDLDVSIIRHTVLRDLSKYDDGNGHMKRDEFLSVMTEKSMLEILVILGVNVRFFFQLQKSHLPKHDSKMRIKDILDLILACRSDAQPGVSLISQGFCAILKDLKDLRSQTSRNRGSSRTMKRNTSI